MNQILDAILKDTFTKYALQRRLRVLKTHLLKAFFGMREGPLFDQKDLDWLGSLPKPFFKKFNKDNVYQIFDALEKYTQESPALIVYLSFEATDDICLQIGSFARKILKMPNLILETKYNPELIAGAAFSWKGMYRDYSLRSKIEARKEEILGNFKKFLK